MQSSDDVEFRDPQRQGLLRLLHHLLHSELEAIGIPPLAAEGTELAAQDAVVGEVDVAVEDVVARRPFLALVGQIGQGSQCVEVLGRKQADRLDSESRSPAWTCSAMSANPLRWIRNSTAHRTTDPPGWRPLFLGRRPQAAAKSGAAATRHHHRLLELPLGADFPGSCQKSLMIPP